jgi:hypothetical protein
MNRAPPAISLRSAPAQLAPKPVMSGIMEVQSIAGAHPDFVREQAVMERNAHIPVVQPRNGKSREENRIDELEQDVAALFGRIEALEAAAPAKEQGQ